MTVPAEPDLPPGDDWIKAVGPIWDVRDRQTHQVIDTADAFLHFVAWHIDDPAEKRKKVGAFLALPVARAMPARLRSELTALGYDLPAPVQQPLDVPRPPD